MEIEGAGFCHALGEILEDIARFPLADTNVVEPAIHFVRGRVKNHRQRLQLPRSLQYIESPQRIDRKVFPRVGHRSRYRNLRCQVEDSRNALHGLLQGLKVPNVAVHEMKAAPMLSLKPVKILPDSLSVDIVKGDDLKTLRQQSFREITANESDSACYQNSQGIPLLYFRLRRSPCRSALKTIGTPFHAAPRFVFLKLWNSLSRAENIKCL